MKTLFEKLSLASLKQASRILMISVPWSTQLHKIRINAKANQAALALPLPTFAREHLEMVTIERIDFYGHKLDNS